MKILFTKILNTQLVSKKLGDHFCCDFHEVIDIKPLKVTPFDLCGHSLIFSSANAVDSFFGNHFQPTENFTKKNFNKIYAVGSKTKKALREKGFGTFKCNRNAKELADFIIDNSTKEKFIHFCGDLALDIINKTLPLQNISYRKIVLYETTLLYPEFRKDYDTVCFFSPSGVRSFAKQNSFDNLRLFSIGETTTEEIEKFTKNLVITSKESSLEDLLQLICASRAL